MPYKTSTTFPIDDERYYAHGPHVGGPALYLYNTSVELDARTALPDRTHNRSFTIGLTGRTSVGMRAPTADAQPRKREFKPKTLDVPPLDVIGDYTRISELEKGWKQSMGYRVRCKCGREGFVARTRWLSRSAPKGCLRCTRSKARVSGKDGSNRGEVAA